MNVFRNIDRKEVYETLLSLLAMETKQNKTKNSYKKDSILKPIKYKCVLLWKWRRTQGEGPPDQYIFFSLLSPSNSRLAAQVEIHLKKPMSNLLSNKISFIHRHHLPQGTAGFCQAACLQPLARLAFLRLIMAIDMAGVKGLVKICGRTRTFKEAGKHQPFLLNCGCI